MQNSDTKTDITKVRASIYVFFILFHFAQKWIWNLTLTKLEFISLEKKLWLWTSKLWILWKTWKQSQRVASNNRAKILVFHFVFLIVLLYSKLIRLITYLFANLFFFANIFLSIRIIVIHNLYSLNYKQFFLVRFITVLSLVVFFRYKRVGSAHFFSISSNNDNNGFPPLRSFIDSTVFLHNCDAQIKCVLISWKKKMLLNINDFGWEYELNCVWPGKARLNWKEEGKTSHKIKRK